MENSHRIVAVFTGNRSEYGLQCPVIKAISQNPHLELRLIVSGSHLSENFGMTEGEIQQDGLQEHFRIEIPSPGGQIGDTARSIGLGIANISQAMHELRPDILVVYGDRYETFAAAVAGTQMGIPTAHIEGGDYTDGGTLDDSLRHAITKLAHLHFTTNQAAYERVKRLGEEEWRILNVGLPALDLIFAGDFAAKEEVYSRFNLDPQKPILIFTQHSVATEFELAEQQIRPSLEALIAAGERWNCQIIITYPNDDAGGIQIIREIKKINLKKYPFLHVHRSLGRHFYHGVLNVSSACVGNSSSGIKETPAFGCPTVNIGSRQRGRLRAENVIDVGYNKDQIMGAIERCLFDRAFREEARNCRNPYGEGNTGVRIAAVLAEVALDKKLIQKRMTF